jgi:hypothetical protein
MKKRRRGQPAEAVYWWSEENHHLRKAYICGRRRYTRSRRRRRGDEATVAHLNDAYRESRRPLQRSIKEVKRRAWDELLTTLESDAWWRPYRLVLNKFRPWAPSTTENMDPQFLEEVLGALFPGAVNEEEGRTNGERELRLPEEEPRGTAGGWSPKSAVTEDELAGAVEKIVARKALGSDGVPARV